MADLNFGIKGNNENFIKGVEQVRSSIRSITIELKNASSENISFTKVMKKTFDAIGGTDALKKFVSDVVRVRGEYQQLELTFSSLLQSKEKADTLMSQMMKSAVATPFSLSELANGAKLLVEYGSASEEVNDTLLQLGDIALGLGTPLEQIVSLYGNVLTQGTLYADDLNNFSASGVPMLQGLADMLGVSTDKVNEMVAAGKIGFPEVQQVIANLTNEGGQFYGTMDKQSQSFVGGINRLQDAWEMMLNGIGESQEGVISGAIDGITSLIENYELLGKVILSLIETYGVYKAACIAHIVLTQSFGTTQIMLAAVMIKLKKTFLELTDKLNLNPWVLAATAIIGLGLAMWNLSERTTAAEKAQKRFNEEQDKFSKQQDKRKQKAESLIHIIKDETETENAKIKAYEELQKSSPALTDAYSREEIANLNLTEAQKVLNEERDKMNYDHVVSKINSLTDATKRLKAEHGKVIGTSTSGMVITIDNSRAIKQNEEDLKNYKEQLNEIDRLKKKAEENSRPIEERIIIAKDYLDKIREEYNKVNTLMIAERAKIAENPFYVIPLQLQLDFDNMEVLLDEATSKVLNLEKLKNKGTTYQQDLKIAKDAWLKAKIDYQNVSKDSDATSFQVMEAKANMDTAEKEYKDLGGVTDDSYKKKAEKIRNEQKLLQELIESQAREQVRSTEDLWNNVWQAQIDSMDEGSEKTLAQMELNHEKALQAIDREKEDLLRKKIEQAEAVFNKEQDIEVAKNEYHIKKTFDRSSVTLSETEDEQINEKYKATLAQQANEVTNYYKVILDKYQDYSTQRLKIEKQYDDDIAILQAKRTAENSDEIDRAIQEAKKKKKVATQQVDDTELNEMKGSNDFLKNLYGDYSQMKFDDLRDFITEAKQLQAYLSGNGSADELKFITKEQLSIIEKSPTGLTNLREALDKLLEGGKANPWDNVFKKFSKGLSKLKSSKNIDDVSEGMKDIGGAASEAASKLAGVADNLSKMFEDMGNMEAAEAIGGIQDAMTAISNIGEGFSKGGIVGGIGAAFGEITNFIGKAFAASARHKEALKEIMNEATAQQRAYNLLLLEQNLLYEKGTTIFGVDAYGKAKNAITVMKDAVEDLNQALKGNGRYDGGYSMSFKGGLHLEDMLSKAQRELYNNYAGLSDIQIKTGHKKTGLFGWGKGKDIYSSVLEVYPELIDMNGKFNASLAETIMNTRTMSDSDKAAFQDMINLSKQAEEALQVVKDYLSGIFGELGNTMSDALVDAFKNGSDAAQSFADSVSDMLESLAKQMVYSVTLAPIIEKAQKQMLGVMQNTDLSDKQKFQQWTTIIGELVNDAAEEQEHANMLYEEFRKRAAEKGFNIFGSDESSSQSSTQQGFAAMSQDTGDELNGRFTALQISNEEIKNSMIFVLGSMASLCTSASDGNLLLTDMRNLALMSNGHLENIAKYTKVLLGFGEKLDNIDRNTKNI